MRNYFLKSIGDHEISYPDSKQLEKEGRFKTLAEYRKIAKKIIKSVGPKKVPKRYVSIMLKSEDYISEIAYRLMLADWNYDKEKCNGKTLYSWRNQAGIWGLADCLDSASKIQNDIVSLSNVSGEEGLTSLSDLIPSHTELPLQTIDENEKDKRIKEYASWLMDNSGLTPTQKKCMELKFGQGIDCAAEVGRKLDPPVTRQSAKQTLDNAMLRIRQTVFGTEE